MHAYHFHQDATDSAPCWYVWFKVQQASMTLNIIQKIMRVAFYHNTVQSKCGFALAVCILCLSFKMKHRCLHHFQIFQKVQMVHEVPLVPVINTDSLLVMDTELLCCTNQGLPSYCPSLCLKSDSAQMHSGICNNTYSCARLSSLTRGTLETLWPLQM